MKNYQKIVIVLVLLFLAIWVNISNNKNNNDITTAITATSTDILINDTNDFYTIDVRIPRESLDKENLMEKNINSIVDVKKEEWKIGGGVYTEEQNISIQFPDRPKIKYELNIKYDKYKSVSKDTASYVFKNYEFTGGAHGNTGLVTYTYDKNGLVDIQNILNLNDGKDIALTRVLESRLRTSSLGEDYNEQMLTEGLGLAFLKKDGTFDKVKCKCDGFNFASNFTNFVVLDEGIKFIFGQYQVGPYAVGFPEVVLTWEELGGYLK